MKQNIHICIHDISGILQTPQLAIPYENTMHSKNFCNTAKSTAKGYGLCITCKVLANKKALKDRKLFYGHCPFGLFEIACPVILNDEVLAIVYVGNLMVTKETSHRKLQSACNITGVSKEKLLSLTDSTEKVSDFSEYISMTEFITSYISLICKTNDRKNLNKPLHWSIEISKAYAENNFDKNITLKELANLYYINEKYLEDYIKSRLVRVSVNI
jgi:ligand-binding sensor protein